MTKRVFSLLMALALCLSLLPVPVWAEETNNNVAAVTIDGTTTQYTDFSKAAEDATDTNGCTLTLLDDVEVSGEIKLIGSYGQAWTFDLNGHTLTQTGNAGDHGFLYIYGGGLTIQDSVGTGRVIGLNRAIYMSSGTFNITGGTFVGKASNGLMVDSNPTVNLSDCTFYTENKGETHSIWYSNGDVKELLATGYRYQNEDGGASGFGGQSGSRYQGVVGKTTIAPNPEREIDYINKDGKAAVCGTFTTVTGETATLTAGWYAVESNPTVSSLNVSGEVNLILCDGAALTVSGALTVADGGKLNLYFQKNGTGKLTAGTVNGQGNISAPAGEMKTTTGTDSSTFEKCLNHDWLETQSGTWTCRLCGATRTGAFVASLLPAEGGNSSSYTTLDEALSAAKNANGSTLKLLTDVTTTEMITISEGTFTLDLNGKRLTWTGSGAGYALTVSGGNVTIQDSAGGGTVKGTDRGVHVTGGTVKISGGTFVGVKSNGLLVEQGCNVKLSGGTFYTEKTDEPHSIWVMNSGKASALLESGYRYEKDGGSQSEYSVDGNGVVGKTTVRKSEGGQTAEHKHDLNIGSDTCSVCGQEIVAYDGEKNYYVSLNEAFEEVTDGRSISLRKAPQNALVYNYDKSVTLDGLYGHYLTTNGADASLTVSAGELIIGASYNQEYLPNIINTGGGYAVRVTGGTLKFADSALNYFKGSAILKGGILVTGEGKLEEGLKEGTILTKESGTHSVSVEGAENYTQVRELLPEGYAFAKYNSDGTTGAVVNGYVTKLTEDVTVVAHADHSYTDGKCACGYECPHTSIDESGKCDVCGEPVAAVKDDNGKFYVTLTDAITAAKDNGTVTLLADLEENIAITDNKTVTIDLNGKTWEGMGTTWSGYQPVPLTVSGGSVTVKNGTLNQGGASTNANTAVIVNGGSLTVGEGMTIKGGKYDSDTVCPAIDLQSGSLTLAENTKLIYGMVSADKTLADYLPEGTAFEDGNGVIDGYVYVLTGDFTLTVTKHTHSVGSTGKCACGYVCNGHSWNNGVCTKCGYVCTHDGVLQDPQDGTFKCSYCNSQMAVKVTNGNTDTYYAKHTDNDYENTLQALLNDDTITPSGSTVTLLMDNLNAWAHVTGGRTITLDLNGKKLIETANGICANNDSQNNKLIVTGTGSSENTESVEYSRAFAVYGGTLEFDDNFGGEFNGIYVDGGTLTSTREEPDSIHIGTLQINGSGAKVSFKQGTFGKIATLLPGVSVKLGDLLEKNSGKAFQYTTGNQAFVPYDTKITSSSAVENVKIAICNHDSVTGGTCDYCGMKNIVAAYYDHSSGGVNTYAADSGSPDAINSIVNNVLGNSMSHVTGTVKLFADANLNNLTLDTSSNRGSDYHNELTIDLNGHTITGGTLTQTGNGKLTITDSSAGKGGSFTNVTVNGGAALIVDGVSVGKISAADKTANITLKAGSQLNGISLSGSGLRLFNCLGEGCCIIGDISVAATLTTQRFSIGRIPGTITPPTDKNVSISYGGSVSENDLPTVTLDDASGVKLEYEWRYRDSDGNYLSYNSPSDAPVTADGQSFDMICIITAKESGSVQWRAAVTGYTLTVTKGQAAVTKAPTAVADLTYTGSAQNLLAAGSADGGEMQYSSEQNGTYSTAIPTGTNAKEYTVWYKVVGDENHNDSQPQSIKVSIAKAKLTVEGTGTASAAYQRNLRVHTITNISGLTVKFGETEIEGTWKFNNNYDDLEVGNTTAYTATFKPTVGGENYETLTTQIVPTITKGTYNGATMETNKNVLVGEAQTGVEVTTGLMPAIEGAKIVGVSVGSDPNKIISNVRHEDRKVIFDVNNVSEENLTATITVTYSSKNYNDFTGTITVRTYKKDPVTVTITGLPETVTYGNEFTLEASQTGDENSEQNPWSWDFDETYFQSISNGVSEGKCTLTLRAIKAGTPTKGITMTYESSTHKGSAAVQVAAISKATPTGAPKYTAISGSGKTLADAGLTTVGGTFSVPGTVAWELPADTEVKPNTAYKWVFTPNNTDNYNSIEGSVTLWHRSSSSSSGSTTPTTPGKTEITTNPDGSIKITPPKNSGETKVVVPVKDVTPGTVAIIVKADGTEEIVKDALPTKDGIELTVDGSVTVKIVDNAKKFVDTKGHWAEDAIDFVSARGLVNGMTETTFAPNAPTTRAQLWTILARQADADLTGGSTWYEKAQEWAKTSGISDGSDPNGNITRAQMVTMLWRAAGSPAVSGSSGFTDVPGDSYYAQAVAWAAEKGITTGVGDGKFDPNGTCTRAQIATFLYRTYVNKI